MSKKDNFELSIEQHYSSTIRCIQKLVAQYAKTEQQANSIYFEAWNHLEVGVNPATVVEGLAYDLKNGLLQKYWKEEAR